MTQPTSPRRSHRAAGTALIRVFTYIHPRHDEALTRQQHVLRGWNTTQPGWQLSGQYVDVRPSRRAPRFGLRRALADARAGRFDVLLVDDLSQLTRRRPAPDRPRTPARATQVCYGSCRGHQTELRRRIGERDLDVDGPDAGVVANLQVG